MAFIAKEEKWEIHLIAGLMNRAVETPVSLPFSQGELQVTREGTGTGLQNSGESQPLGHRAPTSHHTCGWAPCPTPPACRAPDCHSGLPGQNSACVAGGTKCCTPRALLTPAEPEDRPYPKGSNRILPGDLSGT